MADMTLTGESLTFQLSRDAPIEFNLDSGGGLSMELTAPAYLDVGTYTGAVDVSPDFVGTVLETAHKLVTDDITVNPIRVERVSNLGGGVTVFIGN